MEMQFVIPRLRRARLDKISFFFLQKTEEEMEGKRQIPHPFSPLKIISICQRSLSLSLLNALTHICPYLDAPFLPLFVFLSKEWARGHNRIWKEEGEEGRTLVINQTKYFSLSLPLHKEYRGGHETARVTTMLFLWGSVFLLKREGMWTKTNQTEGWPRRQRGMDKILVKSDCAYVINAVR